MIDAFSDHEAQLWKRDPVDTMARCMKDMEAFKPILDYYNDMERTLPKFLTRAIPKTDSLKIQQDYWKHLARRGPSRNVHHLMLLHAMEPHDAIWARKHLLSLPGRLHFNAHVDKFKATHLEPARILLADLNSQEDRPSEVRRETLLERPVPLEDRTNAAAGRAAAVDFRKSGLLPKHRRFRLPSFNV